MSQVRVRLRCVLECEQTWDTEQFEVPVEDVVAAAAEEPEGWAMEALFESGTLTEFTIALDPMTSQPERVIRVFGWDPPLDEPALSPVPEDTP